MSKAEGPGRPSHQMPAYRSAHRARSHQSAHAEGAHEIGVHPMEHPLVPNGAATLLTRPEQLDDLIEHLRSVQLFAYDSEFIGELTYVPKLCLIQVASPARIALIDPLAVLDLRPFWELLADGTVEKIVHAGQQDLEPVVRLLGRAPANVFDTQIAAGFIGLPYPVSLSKLVHELTGMRLGKGLTFTHWDQRPLSAMQLRYAADDVRYLPLLRQKIGERLHALGHTNWAAEACAAQCDPTLYQFDALQQASRMRGAGSLAPRGLAILRELVRWRNNAAQAADLPPRAFLKDEILLDLAKAPVKDVGQLARVRGLPRPVESQHGQQIVQATARALQQDEKELPVVRESEQSPSEKFRTDALWALVQCLCAGQSIDVAVATSRQEISDFYQHIRGPSSASSHRLLTGWRHESIGEALAKLIRANARLELTWPSGALASRIL